MALELKNFPTEVLDHITRFISGFYLLRRLQICGDKVLWSKFNAGGVRTICLNHTTVRRNQLNTALSFPHLRELEIRWTGVLGPIIRDYSEIVRLFPSTLVKMVLHMEGAENFWLRKMSDEESKDPRNLLFQSSGYTVVNMAEKFPLLQHLELRGVQHSVPMGSAHVRWSRPMHCLFFRLLPRSLQYLYIDHLYWILESVWSLFPPHLTHIGFNESAKMNADQLLHLPQTLLDSLLSFQVTVSERDYTSIEAFVFPHHLRSMQWFGPKALLVKAPKSLRAISLSAFRHTSHLMVSEALADFPNLTKLHTHSISALSDETEYPHGLTSLRVYASSRWTTFAKLPQALTSLNFRCDPEHNGQPWTTLPRQLKKLEAHTTEVWDETIWKSLPPNLTHFFTETCATMVLNGRTQLLPRTLRFFGARGTGSIPTEFWTGLGSSLVELSLQNRLVSDIELLLLPNSVTKVVVDRLMVTGALCEPNQTSLTVPSSVSLVRIPGRGFDLVPFELASDDAPLPRIHVLSRIQTLPTSITSLNFDTMQTGPVFDRPVAIPNLQTLTLYSRVQWSQHMPYFSEIPTLTDLHIKTGNLSIASPFSLPPNLTKFRCGIWHSGLRLNFPASVTDITMSCCDYTSFYNIPNLKSLVYMSAQSDAALEKLPKSITKFHSPSWYSTQQLSSVLQAFPNLLDYSGSYGVTDDDLSLAMERGMTQVNLVLSAITLRRLSSLFQDDPLPENTLSYDFDKELLASLAKRYPNCMMNTPRFSLGWKDSRELFSSLLPQNLTTLVLGRTTLPPCFIKWLPKTLTHLDARSISGTNHTTTHRLPPNLVFLHIPGTGFSTLSISYIPKSVTDLGLYAVRKFWSHYAAALPPNLTALVLQTTRISNATIASLPRSLTLLNLDDGSHSLTESALKNLPPLLRVLAGSFPNIGYASLSKLLPPTLSSYSTHFKGADLCDFIFTGMNSPTLNFDPLVQQFLTPVNMIH